MKITELEGEIEKRVVTGADKTPLAPHLDDGTLHVIKYLPADYLADVVSNQELYASERAGFTWGDAIYVAPASLPLCTMMYGEIGVVGSYSTATARFFDASDPINISLYQEWIVFQTTTYRELTTTVHANAANRELRNAFRTRFQIDCVFFRPDEDCPEYVRVGQDWWLAITHWDGHRCVAHGFSRVILDLKWCVVVPDAFKPDARGYRPILYKRLASLHKYTRGHYSTLGTDIRRAYRDNEQKVVICDFD